MTRAILAATVATFLLAASMPVLAQVTTNAPPPVAGAKPVWRRAKVKSRPPEKTRARKTEPPANPYSPFAGLAALKVR